MTKFRLVFRDSRAKNRKLNFNCWENCFVNLVQDLWTQSSFVHNITLKKSTNTVEENNFSFFSSLHYFFACHFEVSLNSAGWIFPVNYNYPRCLENSNIMNFWLTSWSPLWWPIVLVFFFLFTFSLFCPPLQI